MKSNTDTHPCEAVFNDLINGNLTDAKRRARRFTTFRLSMYARQILCWSFDRSVKAAAYLKQHQDHVALQRLRRNKALTPEDLDALEQMLIDSGAGEAADIAQAKEESHGLGLFIRSLVGLDHEAALEAFAAYLDGTKFTAEQIRFINLIVNELTANGVMEPARLYESPYTDHAPTGPETVFSEGQVDDIVDILKAVRANAIPTDGAA